MRWDDPNRPERHKVPRPDEPRDYKSNTGDVARDGYEVWCRRPRVSGYPDMVSPSRAQEIESIVREYDGPLEDY